MPYNQIAVSYPAPGKTRELRAVVEEQARDRQSRGLRATLSYTAWGPEFPAFVLVLAYDSLVTFQKARAEIAASTQEYQAKQAPFVRAATKASLFEVIVPNNHANPQAGEFRMRNVATAAPGKARELRQVMTEWAKWEQANGAKMSLLSQVDGPVGTFVLNRWFDDLGGLEAYRAARSDKTVEFISKRDALLHEPASVSVLELLIPFA